VNIAKNVIFNPPKITFFQKHHEKFEKNTKKSKNPEKMPFFHQKVPFLAEIRGQKGQFRPERRGEKKGQIFRR